MLWRQHCRNDAKKVDERYDGRMVSYKELSRVAGYEVIGDDDLYLVENIVLKQNLF